LSQVPDTLRYTRSHEWLRQEADGSITVGITDHAQAQLGDLVYVELPAVGDALEAGAACAVVESVKAAADVYCPVAGCIEAVNEALQDAPELINGDPYGDGWLFRLKPDDASAVSTLLDAAGYRASTGTDEG
jgi:glycine cleavage system H protein